MLREQSANGFVFGSKPCSKFLSAYVFFRRFHDILNFFSNCLFLRAWETFRVVFFAELGARRAPKLCDDENGQTFWPTCFSCRNILKFGVLSLRLSFCRAFTSQPLVQWTVAMFKESLMVLLDPAKVTGN